ncbi:hypothetical protein BC941DRAFT_444325 [Chlamydoabsidia padenii]|nr:hypothetical protein BC941DRAFT_444325 [Chlamydoabsidia padenii]
MIIPILIKPQIVPPKLLHLFPESLPLIVMKMMMLLLRLMMSLKVMKVIMILILVSVLLLKVLLLLEMLLLMIFLLAMLLLFLILISISVPVVGESSLSESDTVLDRLYRGDTKQQCLNHEVYLKDAIERIRRHRQRIVEERRIQEEDNLHLVEMSYNRMLPEDQATIYNLGSVQSQHPPH